VNPIVRFIVAAFFGAVVAWLLFFLVVLFFKPFLGPRNVYVFPIFWAACFLYLFFGSPIDRWRVRAKKD
jgi:hypothetical protein